MAKSYLARIKMNRSYFYWIVVLAAIFALIVGIFMWNEKLKQSTPTSTAVIPRNSAPFPSYISAVGIVEANGGNIYIGSPVNRIVDKVEVKVGQKVKEGDVLFRLESYDLKADWASRYLEYENALVNLKKLEELPKSEDVASAKAQLKSAIVMIEQAKSQYQRVDGLQKSGAMSDEEINRRRFAFEEAEAKLQQAQANLDKVNAGAGASELEIARLQIKQSKALVERVEADIRRTVIRSPANASVLQIKIHAGEFPPSDSSRTPSMIIGNMDALNLRVSINQFDASYYNSDAKAVAYLQGNSNISFPLKFLHLEPYFVAKQNLNNDITEKVDTRVLQAIYSFKEGEKKVFIGQQMDVFIETRFTPKE
jgi:HlyD family secretion protein